MANNEERQIRVINLSYDVLIGILQGKEIHLVNNDIEIVIRPPFDGMFLTYSQIDNIKYNAEMSVVNLLSRVYEERIKDFDA